MSSEEHLAQLLVDEYLAVKAKLLSGELSIKKMKTRQSVGNWIKGFGTVDALARWEALPECVRKNYERAYPGFGDLLARACGQNNGALR